MPTGKPLLHCWTVLYPLNHPSGVARGASRAHTHCCCQPCRGQPVGSGKSLWAVFHCPRRHYMHCRCQLRKTLHSAAAPGTAPPPLSLPATTLAHILSTRALRITIAFWSANIRYSQSATLTCVVLCSPTAEMATNAHGCVASLRSTTASRHSVRLPTGSHHATVGPLGLGWLA